MHQVHDSLTRELLQRLYETPNDFAEHIRHTAGAIIMEVRIVSTVMHATVMNNESFLLTDNLRHQSAAKK